MFTCAQFWWENIKMQPENEEIDKDWFFELPKSDPMLANNLKQNVNTWSRWIKWCQEKDSEFVESSLPEFLLEKR